MRSGFSGKSVHDWYDDTLRSRLKSYLILWTEILTHREFTAISLAWT